jgi:hypothetical protein
MGTMRISVTSKKGKWGTKNKSGNIESKIGNNITWVARLFSDGPNFIKILYCGPQNFFALFFLHKNHIIDVNFGYFIHKCVINSLDVHPKFDTGAALWPPLQYNFICRHDQ